MPSLGQLTVVLSTAEIQIEPGSDVVVGLRVANTSAITESYRVELLRLPPGVTLQTVPETTINPGQNSDVSLRIVAAEGSSAPAGRCLLGVVVYSPHRRDVRRVEELRLTVAPHPGLELTSELSTVRARRTAVVPVLVRNTGNVGLAVRLGGKDPEESVKVSCGDELSLLPGEEARQVVELTARRPLTGAEVKRRVVLTASSGADAAQAEVALVQSPLVRGGVLRVATTLTSVAVAGAAAVTGLAVAVHKLTPPPAASSPSSSPSPHTSSAPSLPTTSAASSTGVTTSATSSTSTTGGLHQVDLTAPLGDPVSGTPLTDDSYVGVVLRAQSTIACTEPRPYLVRPTDADSAVVTPGLLRTGPDPSADGSGGTPGATATLTCEGVPLLVKLDPAATTVTLDLYGLVSTGSQVGAASYRLEATDASGQRVSKDVAVPVRGRLSAVLAATAGQTLTQILVRPAPTSPDSYVALTSVGWS